MDPNSHFAHNWYWSHYLHNREQAAGMDAASPAQSMAGFVAMVAALESSWDSAFNAASASNSGSGSGDVVVFPPAALIKGDVIGGSDI